MVTRVIALFFKVIQLSYAVAWQIDLPDRDTSQLRYPVQTRIEPAAQDDHRIKSVGKGLDELLIDVPRAA